jgi:7,8-dihydropterin-6-yl-methyl-4-(beta-D-ribofuranosyl)aminobenzene 5'-phosphate synthase
MKETDLESDAGMKVTSVYDNCLSKPGLRTGWAFSCLIETGDAPPVLFDTGADGATLMHNMKRLGIDRRHIKAIVISHAHRDHSGGLSGLFEMNKMAEIYVPASTAE